MRILIINQFYYPNLPGGAEHSVKLLAENLAINGHEVGVYTLDGDGKRIATNPEIVNQVRIFRGYSKPLYLRRIKNEKHFIDKIKNGIHSIRNCKCNKDLREIIGIFKPDVIHTNNPVSISYWIWKYGKTNGIKVVHTLRDYWLLDPRTVYHDKFNLVIWIFRKYHKALANRYVDVVTSPSICTLNIFNNHGYFVNSLKTVIPNSIAYDMDIYKKILAQKRTRIDNVKFLYIGTLSQNKGIRMLLSAFKQLESRRYFLDICGCGIMEQEVIDFESKHSNVHYKGQLTPAEISKEYSKCDVLIVPSIWQEPFGRIVIEAAQYATVTIGSDSGGIPETIKSLCCGEVYHRNSVDELVQCITRFADRAYYAEYMNNIGNTISQYGINMQIDYFEKVYREGCVE